MTDPDAIRWAKEQILRERHKREVAAANLQAARRHSYSRGYETGAREGVDRWLAEYGLPDKNKAIQWAAREALQHIMMSRIEAAMDQICAMPSVLERQARYERFQGSQEAFMRAFLDIFMQNFCGSAEFRFEHRPEDRVHFFEISLPVMRYSIAIHNEQIRKLSSKE